MAKEDLIERIIDLNLDEKNIYKIILVGKRNFEINSRELLKVIARQNILKIKDNTKINFNLEELSKQQNLKGIFVKEVLNMYDNALCTEEECQKAIELGLESM